jgi:hypothetical protein
MRGPDLVRRARHTLHPSPLIGGIERAIEALLERVLIARVRSAESKHRGWGRLGGDRHASQQASRLQSCHGEPRRHCPAF